ncbi:MAG TPA: pyrroloquinoline quinone biosynthesis protein PqqE [Candidatus Dormibacteraeota bacterium]|nr:pyrroloquinoline quinone biosynthesis protein PqqE [Candidatus Dormibacteraeota bacterium]
MRPLSLLCELTYRCNLQCPYCYNPLALNAYKDELDTSEWTGVLQQAAELGVVQAHFSGGEPTLRRDLASLVGAASQAGLYTNLITQGTFLDDAHLDRLIDSGLDHVQISIQAPEAELADRIAGTGVHAKKLEALLRVRDRPVALTLNCVLHRLNHDTIGDVIDFAQRLGIVRLELANVQFYGWAYRNRAALMPTLEQVRRGEEIVASARERLRGIMEIVYVLPDYFGEYPKPCMNGWGSQFMTVTPNGCVLPCPAAAAIAELRFENVRDRALGEIWRDSPAFERFRGTSWMPEPCRSCERREIDWGGCRCQAFLLTGDAAATDPACSKSPEHRIVAALRDGDGDAELVARRA